LPFLSLINIARFKINRKFDLNSLMYE